MFSENYISWHLRFKSQSLEKLYMQSKEKYQQFFLNIIQIYGLILVITSWASNPLKREGLYREGVWLYSLPIAGFFALVSLVSFKLPKFRENLIFLLVVFLYFGFMEISRKSIWNNVMHTISGIYMELTAFPIVLSKVSWKKCLVLTTVFNLFNIFRYTNFASNFQMNFYPVQQFVLNAILICLSSYFVEKFDRESFYKIKSYEYSLSCFKDLIKNAFPSAVIIFKGDDIAFFNNEALELFDCLNKNDLVDKLRGLQIEEASDLKGQALNTLTEENTLINNKQSLSFDQIKQAPAEGSLKFKETSTRHRSYAASLGADSLKRGLEISLSDIIWEDERALLVIVSESEMVKEVRRMTEISEYKDRLLATVSHDLRTPLNGIIGMIRMTMELIFEATARKYLTIALRSSYLLLMMINDVLDYSQISNGKLRLTFDSLNLWDLIGDVCKLIKFQAKLKGLKFYKINSTGSSGSELSITSDPNRLKQVLFNLLGNALKFTLKGHIKVTLARAASESSAVPVVDSLVEFNKAFIISVEDTGIGIKEEDKKNLFKMFGKVYNSDTEKVNKSGVGLGLAISQSLVKALNKNSPGSEIRVESEYGKGSCFSFLINSGEEQSEELFPSDISEKSFSETKTKMQAVERELEKKIMENQNIIAPSRKNKKILKLLVVDDDQINVLVVTSYLKSMSDISFDVTFNGEDAIETIKQKAADSSFYDVILMDCYMPKMSGLEASVILNEMASAGQIPSPIIIACTANASEKDFERCKMYGMKDYLTKPFSREVLRAKIDKYT